MNILPEPLSELKQVLFRPNYCCLILAEAGCSFLEFFHRLTGLVVGYSELENRLRLRMVCRILGMLRLLRVAI
jgi:hypothetical protein